MKAKTVSLVGAAAALAAGPALAAPSFEGPAVPPAASYADLLTPIPNAVERLQLADAQDAAQAPDAQLIQAQYRHHHHHHHHNRRWYMSHGYYWFGGAWVLRPPHHHHHHHHHHNV
jgi:hypothetical protein